MAYIIEKYHCIALFRRQTMLQPMNDTMRIATIAGNEMYVIACASNRHEFHRKSGAESLYCSSVAAE